MLEDFTLSKLATKYLREPMPTTRNNSTRIPQMPCLVAPRRKSFACRGTPGWREEQDNYKDRTRLPDSCCNFRIDVGQNESRKDGFDDPIQIGAEMKSDPTTARLSTTSCHVSTAVGIYRVSMHGSTSTAPDANCCSLCTLAFLAHLRIYCDIPKMVD